MNKKQKYKQVSVIRLLNFGICLGFGFWDLGFLGFSSCNWATEEWDRRY
jgi:hypothetical protein